MRADGTDLLSRSMCVCDQRDAPPRPSSPLHPNPSLLTDVGGRLTAEEWADLEKGTTQQPSLGFGVQVGN